MGLLTSAPHWNTHVILLHVQVIADKLLQAAASCSNCAAVAGNPIMHCSIPNLHSHHALQHP
jgi:hypothetical protein